MGKRIDDIEKSINDIMNDLGEEEEPKASKWSHKYLHVTHYILACHSNQFIIICNIW